MESISAEQIQAQLGALFEAWAGIPVRDITALPRSGSDREYFRLRADNQQAIGVYNPDLQENAAFIGFTNHFHGKGLNVPEIYGVSEDGYIYLQEDLGDETLLQRLMRLREGPEFPESVTQLYRRSLERLADMQIDGGDGLDYSLCYPREAFDKQSMLWDLSYFKYFFLKLSRVPFNEQALEDDFHALADYLLTADTDYFLFRDFQARNIMIRDDEPWFIDYQGGRKGALQYDLASLLYQARADIPHDLRMELLDHYLDYVSGKIEVNRGIFKKYYFGYVLIRTIQVLGAYGFRGFYERKSHFLDSIPYALKNLEWILDHVELPVALPALLPVLRSLRSSTVLQSFTKKWDAPSELTVRVQSFSYKREIPEDPSGNGGGFVFDCRALHNPGRYDPYKKLTGRDQPVIDFLLKNSKIEAFLQHVFGMVEPSVQRYIERGFTHLMVSFGCTGGQHRSVYCADQMAALLKKKYNVNVVLHHIEQERKNWIN